ncbi:MAG TPA: helix-turn-helix domain-containing protein [Pyrinomonadaceae bacterium]|nr:helix-turn-helix domain-containing protein [Pyrinomonadaceae bacterium]
MATAATIGEQLRLAREELHIPLREVSDQTRIQVRYLEAIETNEFDRLPGGIFNRSFVKAYARYVGVDEKAAVESYTSYMRDLGDTGEEVGNSRYHAKVYTDMPATRSPVLTVVLAIVILAILTAAALATVKWYQRRTSSSLEKIVPVVTSVRGVCAPLWNGPEPAGSLVWKAEDKQIQS